MADTPVPPLSRTNYVVERLKSDLADGVLQPGEALRQVQIAQRYGVSVTPVREALRILEADGAITYSPHRGATVRDVDPETAADLYRLRASIEGLATRIAVERMTPERLAIIESAHEDLRQAKAAGAEPVDLSRLNRRLHFTIYEGGSPLVLEHIRSLWTRFPVSVTIWHTNHNAQALDNDHTKIITAIQASNPEEAATLMSTHIAHAASLRGEKG